MIRITHLPRELKARLEEQEFQDTRPGYQARSITTVDGVVLEELRCFCADCQRPKPLFFYVRKELWDTHGINGILCWECFEKRVGRPLTEQDLIGINERLVQLLKERSRS